MQQNKLKDVNYEDYSEFIGLLELKKIPNDTKNDKEYKVIYNCFKNSVLTEKENYLIYRLMCKNKSPLLLFKSVEEIIFAKDTQSPLVALFVFKISSIFSSCPHNFCARSANSSGFNF